VAHRRRDGGRGGGQDLGQVEGVAADRRHHRAGVEPGGNGQLGHGLVRQPLQLDPEHRRPGQGGDHAGERVVVAQLLVAVADHQQRRQAVDPPGQVPDDVQGGGVGPVGVLDDDHGRALGEAHLGEQGVQEGVAVVAGQPGQAPGVAGHVPERPQRPRGEQVLARPDQHPGRRPGALGELLEQRGLADPGLPRDQHGRPPALPGVLEGGRQAPELGVALDQGHRHATSRVGRFW
jgi:hypothetical protein